MEGVSLDADILDMLLVSVILLDELLTLRSALLSSSLLSHRFSVVPPFSLPFPHQLMRDISWVSPIIPLSPHTMEREND